MVTGELSEGLKRRGLAGVFLIVLAGIVLFSILALFATSEESGGNVFVGFLPRELLSESEVGLVGAQMGEGFRHIYLGKVSLSSGASESTISIENGPVEIARGIITSQEHQIRFNHSKSPAKVSFVVDETNSLGTLVARVNGQIAWSGIAKTGDKIEFFIPSESLKEGIENVLVFISTSSGWRIWSPSYYRLEEIHVSRLGSESLEKSKKFGFSLSKEEVSSFVLGRVVFTVSYATPESVLSAKINGATIWKGPVGGGTLPVSIDFSSAGTNPTQENEVLFSIESDGKIELSMPEIIVFTSSSGRGTPAETFSISKEDYELFQSGRMVGKMEFSVSEISSPGTLEVSIVGDREVSVYSSKVSKEAKVSVTFVKGSAVTGKNLVVFSSPDGGIFKVKNLSIRLERS